MHSHRAARFLEHLALDMRDRLNSAMNAHRRLHDRSAHGSASALVIAR